MKKICLSIATVSIILLMVNFSFAQSPRQPTSSEGKTTFTNVAVTGLDQSGVPGYIELRSTDDKVYYLFIDNNQDLRIASEQPVGSGASPQTTTWTVNGQGLGIVVGDQARP